MLNAMEDIMTNTNIKLVQEAYGAFGRGDIPAALDMMTPDMTWGMIGREKDVPMAGIRNGKAGAAEFFRLLKETQEIKSFEPQKFAAADDMVFVAGHTAWTMQRNGVSGESDWVHVFTIRDGKISAYRGHQDTGLLAEAYHAMPAAKRAVNS